MVKDHATQDRYIPASLLRNTHQAEADMDCSRGHFTWGLGWLAEDTPLPPQRVMIIPLGIRT